MVHIIAGTDLCTNPTIMLVLYSGWFTALHLHIITMGLSIATGDTIADHTGQCILIVHTIPGMSRIIIRPVERLTIWVTGTIRTVHTHPVKGLEHELQFRNLNIPIVALLYPPTGTGLLKPGPGPELLQTGQQ